MKKIFAFLILLSASLASFGTDWSSYEWLADGAGGGTYANKYKVANAFGQQVINIQKPGFAAEAGIYTTFPAAIASCTMAEGTYIAEGAGAVLYLSAFTAKETSVTIVAGGVTYDFKVYYENGTGEVADDEGQGTGGGTEGTLTPATFYGTSSAEVAGEQVSFKWHITRNANSTLTLDITWTADISGAVPQVCINDAYTTMPCEAKHAMVTTTETFEDGATPAIFFYIAYTGGAARIDVSYTVGASNEDPDNVGQGIERIQPSAVSSQKVIRDGQLLIIRDGRTYDAMGQIVR